MKPETRLRKTMAILDAYSGTNPVIQELKKADPASLSPELMKYIAKFSKIEPVEVNRIVDISAYAGTKLKKLFNLSFLPVRIYVYTVYGVDDGNYHILGKFTGKGEAFRFWVKRAAVFEDLYKPVSQEMIKPDFSKYPQVKLYSHQSTGIETLVNNHRYILGDDMGLGKSLQSVFAALEVAKKVLIVCPASVKYNWANEVKRFTDEYSVVDGYNYKPDKFTIINFDILKNFHTPPRSMKDKPENYFPIRKIAEAGFDLMIVDEAHVLRNQGSIRSQIVLDLCTYIERVWLLTGTPITNRPLDFFTLLAVCDHPISRDWSFYVKQYCAGVVEKVGKRKKEVWHVTGNSNLEELARATQNVILRRRKEDVLDLPDKIIRPVILELTSDQKKKYGKLMEEYEKQSEKEYSPVERLLVERGLRRKYIAEVKIDTTIELVEEALEKEKKVLVFTCFTETLKKVFSKYEKKAMFIDGSVNPKNRQKRVEEFQNNPDIRVGVLNIIAGGVGLTLTAAEVVIFNDLAYTPAEHLQASDRAMRIGQSKAVNYFYPLMKDTVDDEVLNLLNTKMEIIDIVVEKRESTGMF